jgi:hypothetical protein
VDADIDSSSPPNIIYLQILYPLRQALFGSYPGVPIGNCTTACLGLKCTSAQALYTSTLTNKNLVLSLVLVQLKP